MIAIRRATQRGELPGVIRIGRHVRYDLAKVRAFIDNGGAAVQQKAAEREAGVR